jgi:hypothetical protein
MISLPSLDHQPSKDCKITLHHSRRLLDSVDDDQTNLGPSIKTNLGPSSQYCQRSLGRAKFKIAPIPPRFRFVPIKDDDNGSLISRA